MDVPDDASLPTSRLPDYPNPLHAYLDANPFLKASVYVGAALSLGVYLVGIALSTDLSLEETVNLVKDAFYSAGERDIRTGDAVEICIITKDGVRVETYPLNID